jgi:hypothetical protein
MKVLIGFIIGIAAIALIAVLVLGYFGFMPGVSSLFGSNKPVKLGTTFTQQDYQSALTKVGVQMNDNLSNVALDKNSKVYGPPKQVSFDLTPSEALAVLNLKPYSSNFPAKDWDIRINADKSIEVSSIVKLDKLTNSKTMNDERVKTALASVNKAGLKEVPVYLKGSAVVVNGQLNLDAASLKVGKLSIPANQVNDNKGEISNFFQDVQKNIPGLSIQNASIINGKIHIDGTMPSSVSKRK